MSLRKLLLVALFVSASAVWAQEPALFLSATDFQQRNRLADHEAWAAQQRAAILHAADEFPASYERAYGLTTMELPPEGGQWLHYYACADTGTQLKFQPPASHVCPDNGTVYKGYPYDEVVYMLRADDLRKGALTAALAYRLTGKMEYAEKASRVLLAYADKYNTYAFHDNSGKTSKFGARVYSQSLDESIWLIDLAWTYDLVRGSGVLNAANKKHIETDLLRASAATVSGPSNPANPAPSSPTDNIQSWINAAVGSVGYVLHDDNLIHQALDGPLGFHYQMKHFVIDGVWVEGAWGYQFYALRALTQLATMATQAGNDLWTTEPNLLRLCESPLQIMFADGTLPPFNDTRIESIFTERPIYEMAYGATHDATLLRALEREPRQSRESFLFGAESLPPIKASTPESIVLPEAGYAVERGKGDLTVVMKFGPHGGPHGHYDKLNEIIYANGHILSTDPGTQYYGLPIHKKWDSMTIAHNTLSVDQKRQQAATGKLLSWQKEKDFTAATASAGDAYPNVAMERTILTTDDYILEITTAQSEDDADHVFDWNFHGYGQQSPDPSMKTASPFQAGNGYEYMGQLQEAVTTANIQSLFADPQHIGLKLTLLNSASTEIFRGMAPGNDLKVPVPFLIARRSGRSAQFIALFQPVTGGSRPLRITMSSKTGVTVEGEHWTDAIQFDQRVSYHRTTH